MLLDHARQEARWKPLCYSNDLVHRSLGWRSTQRLDDALQLAIDPMKRVRRG